MMFEGRIWKSGKHWIAEIPGLDYLTQGKSYKDALAMAKDIVESGIGRRDFKVKIKSISNDTFVVVANNSKLIVAHMLKRLRQKHGLTVREVSKRMGSSSPNTFGAYEQGKAAPTLEKLEELLSAIHSGHSVILKIA